MKQKIIAILMLICITLAIIIGIVIVNISPNNNTEQPGVSSTPHIKTAEENNQEEIEQLHGMGETRRMQFYVSKYISYIEAGDYESAYNLLYSEFKENYFETLDKFISYIKQKYPDIISLKYTNIQRLGEYYVLTVDFEDLVNNEKNYTQLFVVKENGFNDFVLSFQAE